MREMGRVRPEFLGEAEFLDGRELAARRRPLGDVLQGGFPTLGVACCRKRPSRFSPRLVDDGCEEPLVTVSEANVFILPGVVCWDGVSELRRALANWSKLLRRELTSRFALGVEIVGVRFGGTA